MSSVLQGGRRRRRPGMRLARLLVLLAPLAVVAAVLFGFRNHDGHKAAQPGSTVPAEGQQVPGGTPSPGTAAPDPEQAALAGVDAFHLRFSDPPRAGMVFDVKTGEVLWRRNPLKRTPIAGNEMLLMRLDF